MIKKSISLTAEGKKELEDELAELIANRPAITERIATARAFGDLSENEEYSSARNEQKVAEGRILEIQEILKNANKYLNKWTIDRLGNTDQAILRMGIFEILYMDTPDIVAINEAVELAKNYSDDDVKNMINAVLDNVYKEKIDNGE